VDDLFDRAALGFRPPSLGGIAHRDQRHRQRVLGQPEQFSQFVLVTAVERGQRGADAVGAGGEAELLYRAVDG
jgi:hypothetical protein